MSLNTLFCAVLATCMVMVGLILCGYIYQAAKVFFGRTETGRWIWRKVIRPTGRALYDFVFLACAMTRCPGVAGAVLNKIQEKRRQRDALETAF